MERSLVLIKPDAVERRLIGQIIAIYESKGLKIVALKMIQPSREIAENHYREHQDKHFFQDLVTFFTRGKVCALIIEGDHVIETVRKINGATDPAEAEMGTIRGRFATSKSENIVHASDSAISAEREIKIWFADFCQKEEITNI
jgi:nucleoside-diphosphate kinase